MTEFRIPLAFSSPYEITPGPDGALWFTQYDSDTIGHITTTGVLRELAVPTQWASPIGVTSAFGSVWFTEYVAGKVGVVRGA